VEAVAKKLLTEASLPRTDRSEQRESDSLSWDGSPVPNQIGHARENLEPPDGVEPSRARYKPALPPRSKGLGAGCECRARFGTLTEGHAFRRKPARVESTRIERALLDCGTSVLPLDDDPVERAGIGPAFRDCQPRVLPLDERPEAGRQGLEPCSVALETTLRPSLRPSAS
jgi:hypothetical protein